MENNTDKSASEILLEAADLLSEENTWSKGTYFKATAHGCVMCAHGAIAYCGNSEIKNKVNEHVMPGGNEIDFGQHGAGIPIAVGSDPTQSSYYTEHAQQENLSLEQYLAKHHKQSGLAHYKAAKVGLTISYNDSPNTTQQDVINKLREAALL